MKKNNYLENIDEKIKKYFNILEPEFPDWLIEYINTKELQKQKYISITCGTIYSDLFESKFFFSSLDHSIAVALICWHFTHDKKITLSGLFHDISTPAFKHCVDYLKGDYMVQESTEDLTTEIINNSKEIMNLLKRDNISLYEVNNYHIYPIADNDTPQLSSDRLEYSLSNSLFTYNLIDFNEVKNIYNNVNIQINKNKEQELGFINEEIALKFVDLTTKLSIIYREDRTRFSMQFLADILKRLNKQNIIKIEDLYSLKEKDVINLIENSIYNNQFKIWKNSKKVKISKTEPKNVYCVHHSSKIRYINPLIKNKRISEININANNMIKNNLNYDMTKYT